MDLGAGPRRTPARFGLGTGGNLSYTEEEKVFFVERMWAEGLTPSAAWKKWGRPCRRALSAWLRQAEAGELPARRPRARGRAITRSTGNARPRPAPRRCGATPPARSRPT